MDDIPDELLCPICLDAPDHHVLQCRNRHNVCSKCIINLTHCPQCRVSYASGKSRNATVESLLDAFKFDCPNKAYGCKEKVFKSRLELHVTNCGQVNICDQIGFDCGHLINIWDSNEFTKHFEEFHCAIVKQNEKASIQMEDICNLKLEETSMWTPVILISESTKFILFSVYNKESKAVSWYPLFSGENLSQSNEYVVMFDIVSSIINTRRLTWNVNPIPLTEVAEFFATPLLQIPVETLIQYYRNSAGAVKINVSISAACSNLSFSRTLEMKQKNADEHVSIFNTPISPRHQSKSKRATAATYSNTNNTVYAPGPSRQQNSTFAHPLSENFSLPERCMECKTVFGNTGDYMLTRYICPYKGNIGLCAVCFESCGVLYNVLIRIDNQEQLQTLCQSMDHVPRTEIWSHSYKRFFNTEIKLKSKPKKLPCYNCGKSGQKFVCIQCLKRHGACESCVDKSLHEKKSANHIFIVCNVNSQSFDYINWVLDEYPELLYGDK